jgi:4-hydroxybenzoate polyprenyltransferase
VESCTYKCEVIAVDLDGTLLLTDTLHESVLAIVRDKPISLFALPYWLLQGKATFKDKLAEHFDLDVTTLPYNRPLISWLRDERAAGKKIVLCTAANYRVANSVASYLQLFDEIIASDASNNIKGGDKRQVLEQRFGAKGYDYAGNDSADVLVWAGAAHAIIVNASHTTAKNAAQVSSTLKVFPPQVVTFSDWCRVFRVHQWLKNTLLFLPLLAAHQINNLQAIYTLAIAFLSFSLCASAVYISNDLLDLKSDRKHPRKSQRPFATGIVPILTGAILAPVLAISSLALGLVVGSSFTACLIVYLLLTSAYSLWLKRLALIDCLTLSGLYTIRIISGAVATQIDTSAWILAFSVFLFHSLAYLKRYSELKTQEAVGNNQVDGRDYSLSDAPLIQTIGIVTGCSAAIVLSFYLNSEKALRLYTHPEISWLSVPLILFWISYVWLVAHRGKMHDDPVVFAIKDRVSLIVALCVITVFVTAT